MLLVLGFADLDAEINSRISRLGPQMFQCMDCEFNASKKSTVSNHIESKHIGHAGVSCNICGKVCVTRQAYRMHKSRDHKQYS
jgi:transcription elongation factor Elf1